MTVAAAPQPRSWRRGRSFQAGVYAGRYLTKKARERREQAAADDFRRRAQFLKNRDVQYRRALGLTADEPLPATIGRVEHSRAPITAKTVAA